MGKRGFPLTPLRIKSAVKVYLDKSKINIKTYNYNRPGKSWWYGFLRRHPDLKVSKSEQLEVTRAMACTKESIDSWLDDFKKLLKDSKITSPKQIYNCDEAGFPLQAKNNMRVCVD